MRSALEELVIIAPQIYSTPYLLKPEIDPSHSKAQQTELDIPLKRDYVQNNVEKGSEDLRFLTKWYVIKSDIIPPLRRMENKCPTITSHSYLAQIEARN